MKCRLIKLPVLHVHNTTGRFHLYSDTSKFATGGTVSDTEWKAQIHSLCKQKITRSSKKLVYYRTRAMWISHKHSQLFSLVKKS